MVAALGPDDSLEVAPDAAPAADVQATYCATLADEWIRRGVRHAVVAPGSRSTPMALALAARDELEVHVVHDERVAAFVALGLGIPRDHLDQRIPALLLCTSGTAAANFLPAVVEAGLSAIPMIVLTADRPDELRGVGAPQTIDQVGLYGTHVRWSCDPGVPDATGAGEWRALASTAFADGSTGPVQLNLAFREPLVGVAGELPPPVDDVIDLDEPDIVDAAPPVFDQERGVILVGGAHGVDPDAIVELGRRTRWPIVADPQSGLRGLGDVTTIDALLRVEAVALGLFPEVIVRIGRPSTSKVLAQWTAAPGPVLIQVGGPGRIDPAHNVAAVCTIESLLDAAPTDVSLDAGDGRVDGAWLGAWKTVESLASRALRDVLSADGRFTEPAVARTVADHLPPGVWLTVSSSMPVRDLEWFGGSAAVAHANRGANGIDGVISTALGRSLRSGEPGVVLIGDLAFVHDSNALVALRSRGVDLRIVVIDNDGGGIFSFLSQAASLDHSRFEQLFGTPLGTDVLAIAAAHRLETCTVTTRSELTARLQRPGPWVCRVASSRPANVDDHDALNAAIQRAVEAVDLHASLGLHGGDV